MSFLSLLGGPGQVTLYCVCMQSKAIAGEVVRKNERKGRKRRRVARETGALPFKLKGGARPGAGRKPKGERAGVPHRRRREFKARCPAHVTVKLLPGMARLRRGREYRALRAAFAAGCDRNGFRLVHYAVLNDHLHLIVEADEEMARAIREDYEKKSEKKE